MRIFIFLFVYLLAMRMLSSSVSISKRRLFLTISSGLGLWLVLALRSAFCGIDLLSSEEVGVNSYYNAFHNIEISSWHEVLSLFYDNTGQEFGWLLYNKLVSSVLPSFQFLLATTAAIQIILIGHIIFKYSEDVQLSFIVYFAFGLYAMSFSGLRQSMAYAITFFATDSMIKNKKILFVLLVVLASMFHKSALIFLVALPLSKITMTNKNLVISIITLVALMPFVGSISSFLVTALFPDRYQNYNTFGGQAINMLLLYVALSLFSLKIPINDNKFNGTVKTMILCSVASQSLGIINAGAMTRIGYYFSMYFLFLFPLLVKYYAPTERKLVTLLLSLALLIFFVIGMSGGYMDIVPYHFCWEKGAQYIW